jgi:formylmethanofuran dehydrogenase subunit E
MSTTQNTRTNAKSRKPKAKPVQVLETAICYICGVIHSKDNIVEFDGKSLCSTCLENETFICSHCCKRMWNDYDFGSFDTPMCEKCLDAYYTRR